MAYGNNVRKNEADKIMQSTGIDDAPEDVVSSVKGLGAKVGGQIQTDTKDALTKMRDTSDKAIKSSSEGMQKRKLKEDNTETSASKLKGFVSSWLTPMMDDESENISTEQASMYTGTETDGSIETIASNKRALEGSKNFEKLIGSLVKSTGDTEFPEAVTDLAEKYDIPERTVYSVIYGENRNFKHNVTNSSGYKGLFQIGKSAAKDAGIDYNNITKMSPTEQIAAYDDYLTFWKYDNTIPLGIMQAAPGLAKDLKDKSNDTVIYKVGSAAWKKNKNWRSKDNGDITKGSIINYYANI
tara:strand:- start:5712 stop:6605 length:894 start_codon:yes stop_codon:yes gene_type:complete